MYGCELNSEKLHKPALPYLSFNTSMYPTYDRSMVTTSTTSPIRHDKRDTQCLRLQSRLLNPNTCTLSTLSLNGRICFPITATATRARGVCDAKDIIID